MRLKSKVNVDGNLIEFEFEGDDADIAHLDDNSDKIKTALIKLATQ
ncbi:MAG: hypothetical protein V1702_01565 [Candidatus Woesearchaeota archaeon]